MRRTGIRCAARVRRVVLALAAVSLLAAACGDDDEAPAAPTGAASTSASEGSSTTAADQPQRGGRFVFAWNADTRGLDPLTLSRAIRAGDNPFASAIYDSLMYEDRRTGEIKMQIAESLTSRDGVVWDLKLRPNVRFSDGTPFDAEAVKFNWERIGDPANGSVNSIAMRQVSSLQAVDPLTLRATLKEPNGQFPGDVAKLLTYIGSPTAIRAAGADFGKNPIGAGPFVLRNRVPDSETTFVRNPTYWNAPRPYLDELVIRVIPDDEQRYSTFRTGAAHAMDTSAAAHYGPRAEADGHGTIIDQPNGGRNAALNMARAPFDDIRARLGVYHALDLEAYNTAVFQGASKVPRTLFRETSPFYDSSITLPGHDAQKAQQLFDEYAAAHGGPVQFTMTCGTASRTGCELNQAQLSRFRNVDVRLEVIPTPEASTRINQRNFQWMSWAIFPVDPQPDLYDHFLTGSPQNYIGYSNPEMDAALIKGKTSLRLEERVDAYKTVQRLLARDVPYIWTDVRTVYLIYDRDRVHDIEFPAAGILWDRVWLEP